MGTSKFFCEECGKEVPFNAEVCPFCGRGFDSVKCPICGYIGKAERFGNGCPKCGYLRTDTPPRAGSPSRAPQEPKSHRQKRPGQDQPGASRKAYSRTPRWAITLAMGLLSILLVLLVILYISL